MNTVVRVLQDLKPDVAFNALHGKWGEDGCASAVVITADPTRETEERPAAHGLELLRKPVRPAELRALMAHLVG